MIKMKRIPEFLEDFSEVMNELHTKSRFSMTKKFIQHGDVSVYQHCIFVAYMSCRIANKFNLNVDKRSLIRGALLHDYFLYDWHDKNKPAKFHGFTHPKIAFENACQDLELNKKERDIILHHNRSKRTSHCICQYHQWKYELLASHRYKCQQSA